MLAMGADGVVLGTRLVATPEATLADAKKVRLQQIVPCLPEAARLSYMPFTLHRLLRTALASAGPRPLHPAAAKRHGFVFRSRFGIFLSFRVCI